MSNNVKKYNTDKYPFSKIICNFFEVDNLENLHLLDKSLCKGQKLTQENEANTNFHKKYYKKLNDGWPELETCFQQFVENEISPLFKCSFLYQTMPSFRVQVPNQIAVSNWHYDTDYNHGHPDWEINIQIALTDAFDTNATWVESIPGLGDYKPMNLLKDEYTIFNGNKCIHGNYFNQTKKTRVSYDFRVIPYYIFDGNGNKIYNVVENNSEKEFVGKLNSENSFYGRKWTVGQYYSVFKK